MTIQKIKTYKDGGTIEIITDRGTFCIDRRLISHTNGRLFFGYPSDNNIVENYSDLLEQIKQSLDETDTKFVDVNWIKGLK
jgi:hypothetical protein